ncbi:NAD(P)/FAD-dependent oxidoreductase [Conexibacter sp. CPCC 206217]|uniref:dihydrolipoyl dehydrogenase family protein n=1 Tax=Conexibacter sp. CPCC 206217 TaxID=3064574 RepID=UPI00271CE5ED|nr:NAD(P)/FAD-dependent oxidoreductase [Conexibacter sp. CPCC 206217]MDO8210352.1 NAD(P)/FAD-dependent oxidoreductase [Conexibacter sp. CPCC 206217]
MDHFDVIVIGTGPGGRAVAPALAAAGRRVAVVEAELVGGECPFWACIPSKTLLRPGQLREEARHVAGVGEPAQDWLAIRDYRDYMNSGLDDAHKAQWLESTGVTLLRGEAQVPERGTVLVGECELRAPEIVLASGSRAVVPEIPGLQREHVWTNREVTSLREVPRSAVVLGSGPVGLESAQYLSQLGCVVTLLERAERPLSREDPEVSEHVWDVLRAHGVDVRTHAEVTHVQHDETGVQVHTADGGLHHVERLVVATGRAPRVEGLVPNGVSLRDGRVEVDARCHAAEGFWAVGDVTGVAPFTHVAGYQGRVVVDNLLGRDARADYRAVPRVVFGEPEVAAVGMTAAQAAEAGLRIRSAHVALAEVDRTETYGRELFGGVGVLLDAARGVLVGAWAVGPEAGEWIHTPALAIKAAVPLAVLRDFVPQFPTFNELWGEAARKL